MPVSHLLHVTDVKAPVFHNRNIRQINLKFEYHTNPSNEAQLHIKKETKLRWPLRPRNITLQHNQYRQWYLRKFCFGKATVLISYISLPIVYVKVNLIFDNWFYLTCENIPVLQAGNICVNVCFQRWHLRIIIIQCLTTHLYCSITYHSLLNTFPPSTESKGLNYQLLSLNFLSDQN